MSLAISYPPQQLISYGKRVLIGMPWQKVTNPLTSFCVNRLVDTRRCAMTMNHGDAFVAHTRAAIVDIFLKSDLEWLLCVDDDMILPVGDANVFRTYTGFDFPEKFMSMNALDRLMSHGKTLVGALYMGRQSLNSPPVYNEGMSNKDEAIYARKGPHDLIKPTKWVGTGCMLTHRSVFEAVEKRFPKLARTANQGFGGFYSGEASLRDRAEKIAVELHGNLTPAGALKAVQDLMQALSMSAAENPFGCGEDVAFCMRAAAAGHQPYVDMGLRCGHLGTFCY